MLFKIKAKKTTGEIIEGVREASDKFSLAREMRNEDLVLFYAEPLSAPRAQAGWNLAIFQSVPLKDKIIFASNLSSMISAGLTLSRSLEVLERQTVKKYFKSVIRKLLEKINAGENFSSALGSFPDVFPPVFVAMVAAGEESGNLPNSLMIVKDQFNKTYELTRKVKGAMIYPAIILIVIAIIAVLMMIFLVPTLTATFRDLNAALPFSTRLVILISDFLSQHYLIFLTSVLGLGLAGCFWKKTVVGKKFIDYFILNLPIFGELNRQYNSAVIMRTIASLIASGVSMTKTLEITEKVVQNSFYKRVMAGSGEKIEKGILLSKVFGGEQKLFPGFVTELTEVGEETGNLSDMLRKGAEFYEGEVDQATKNLSTIIEPLLMVIIGIAVGFFVVAMIGPIYSLSDAIG